MTRTRTILAAVAGGLLLGTAAAAEEVGRAEYLDACASCHGESAQGDGPLADLMTIKVPGLTGLAAANDGQFPMLDVIHSIDGRQGTRGHGYPMPVWGKRFAKDLVKAGPYGGEVIIRGRILSIAYYLESIQE
ncbi:c-type cytochrome [Roseovarius salis]|uniref:c-type cytochrome n=1 Tax=Roseovarius salis TaxID=3376063 RepID=UPI0037C69E2F